MVQFQCLLFLQHFCSLRSESSRAEEKGWGQREDWQVQADGLLHHHCHSGRAVAEIFGTHFGFICVSLSAHGHGRKMHHGHIWVLVWITHQSDATPAFCVQNTKTLQVQQQKQAQLR